MKQLLLAGKFPVSYPTFVYYFSIACPEIQLKSLKKDCCNYCLKIRNQLLHGNSKQKSEHLRKQWNNHLEEAIKRRNIYKTDISINAACSNTLVLSFDYKQNLALPITTWQACMLYFKCKWNVNCFNIVKEGSSFEEHEATEKHDFYLYDERHGSKSANEIITMLFEYLKPHFNSGKHLIFYCDNSCGQNKNQYEIAFFSYLILQGYFESIRIKFMVIIC